MTAAILPFPGNHHAPGGQAFTEAALDLARDVIAGKDTFWPAVIVLAESPDQADRDWAKQILEAHRLGMAAYALMPEPEPSPVARSMNAMQYALAGATCLGISALVAAHVFGVA